MTPIIELRGITKIYPNGVVANDGVSLSIEPGEIHALVGENGAGKTTLMKILYGMEPPTSGEILIEGSPMHFHATQDAIRAGIGMVHQNFMLIPSFTVAENIVLGQEPISHGLIDKKKAIAITRQLSQQYGLSVEPEATIEEINVGMRQRVEILKTLFRGAKFLILDEPSAVLTPQETQELFRAVRQLVRQGKTVIFITHKLKEVKAISDRVTILRDGKVMGTLHTDSTSREEIAQMMTGREMLLNAQKTSYQRGAKAMTIKNLTHVSENGRTTLKDISFNLYAGEILGIAGVEGNGQSELVEVLTGLRPATTGSAMVEDVNILNKSPRQVRTQGIAHIPEDRSANGLALNVAIDENLIIDRYFRSPYRKGMFIDYRKVRALGKALIERYDIRTPNGELPVASLSGGNMQKVIVARELSAAPRILIAAQPTRGVDIGATEFIRDQLLQKRSEGAAVLLISADLSEVLELSDRIITMVEGQITGVFTDPSRLNEEALGLFMLGINHQTASEMEDSL